MNTVATPCIMAVPSMLMVAPIGTVNEATLFFTPILYSTVRSVTGMVAPELAVEKARVKVLACPARDQADRLALMMLQQLLDRTKWEISLAGVETLASELVERVVREEFRLVCISALPPGGLAHTRYLCKRLKSGRPGVQILVGRWGLKGNWEGNEQQLQAAGADLIATTLLESLNQLTALLPLFAAKAVNEAVASPALR